MREKAELNGQDLLIIDTGDRIEGNGLYDASDPKGQYSFDIVKQLHMDVVTIGNHELYKKNSSENEYLITVPNFKDSYIASNIDIYDPDTGKRVPLAPRFKKFTTKVQDIRIIAFGFLFDFYGNYNNTIVQPVEETIKEEWFQDAIRDRDVDLFLVAGHVPIKSEEFTAIFRAIREIQWDTPIQFFGGHTHIRDYAKYDSKSYALQSGRFMETIGFQSINGLTTGGRRNLKTHAGMTFSRTYIDNNLFSFHHHSSHNETTFATEHGRNVSDMIKEARQALNLDSAFGCAPKDLWMNRAKYPSDSSIYTWLETKVMPSVIRDPSRSNKTTMAITNTGGIRFDLFKGPFTVDTTFIVSPFTSGFRYIKDAPYDKASKLIRILNSQDQYFTDTASKYHNSNLAPSQQQSIFHDIIGDENSNSSFASIRTIPNDQTPLDDSDPKIPLTPGYTTTDDAGSDGDDTLHSKISFYRVPNCIQAIIPPATNTTVIHIPSSSEDGDGENKDPEVVDVVYIDFIEPWMLLAARFAGLNVTKADTDVYLDGNSWTVMIQDWVKENWPCQVQIGRG
jgi:hypothetical protein